MKQPSSQSTRSKLLLAGDVGGTKTILGLFQSSDGELQPKDERVFNSQQYDSLEAMIREFLAADKVKVDAASFGVAAAIVRGRAITNNISWQVDARDVAALLDLREVGLINDLEANAYGIDVLKPSEFLTINEGCADPDGNRAVISAGTGLGVAGMVHVGGAFHTVASQGGLTDFAPTGESQIELLRYLARKNDHVSWETVLSGPGLRNIYEFLYDTGRGGSATPLSDSERGDLTAAITEAALSGTCSVSGMALDIFVAIYGAKAGNVALDFTATGGVYVGGGIAPRIARRLSTGPFMLAFLEKGCRKPVLENVPVKVILNPKAALLGAAHHAALAEEVIAAGTVRSWRTQARPWSS